MPVGKSVNMFENLEKHPCYGMLGFSRRSGGTVMEAKGEVEAFCQNKMNSIAQAALVGHKEEMLCYLQEKTPQLRGFWRFANA